MAPASFFATRNKLKKLSLKAERQEMLKDCSSAGTILISLSQNLIHYFSTLSLPFRSYLTLSLKQSPLRSSYSPSFWTLRRVFSAMPLTYSAVVARIPLLLFTQLSVTLAQQCYYPDGSVSPNYTACNTTASATNCCAQGEACLSSGLCYMTYDMSINTGTCTDKKWQSPECFQQCPNGRFGPYVPHAYFALRQNSLIYYRI